MKNADVHRAVQIFAVEALSSGELPTVGLPLGVWALAVWRYNQFGSVLFFAEPTSGLYPFGLAGCTARTQNSGR